MTSHTPSLIERLDQPRIADGGQSNEQPGQKLSHTPTPWEYRAGDCNRDDHGSAPGSIISTGDEWFIATIEDAPSAEANAAFIVRAVNSHDALLKALELARKRIEFYGQISGRQHFDRDLKEILPVINAALASAKGSAQP